LKVIRETTGLPDEEILEVEKSWYNYKVPV
jgi:hypothetical protein